MLALIKTLVKSLPQTMYQVLQYQTTWYYAVHSIDLCSSTHSLLADNQLGFLAKRSTMSAWADMQQDWASNSEKKMITGTLLWDLSIFYKFSSDLRLILKLP